MKTQQNSKKTLLIIGGDTGGHLYPAISVADYLRGRFGVFFFIGARAVVREIIEKKGFPHFTAGGRAFPGLNIFKYPVFIAANVISIFRCRNKILKLKPAAVFSTGGYMSFAPALAAKALGVPLILHEQNIMPGMANIVNGFFARKVAVSFAESGRYFKAGKVVLSGNPVRKEILDAPKTPRGGELRVLVTGGSQGANFLNKLFAESVESMNGICKKISVIHITGQADYNFVSNAYKPAAFKYEIYPYSHNIETLYSRCDLVVCRSGAGSIFELIALKKPAILVPFPRSARGHQHYNAKYLADNGCALLRKQEGYSTERLLRDLAGLSADNKLLESYSLNYGKLPESKLNALEIISGVLEKYN